MTQGDIVSPYFLILLWMQFSVHGSKKFGIMEMIDTDGNKPQRRKVAHVKVWFKDGRECHKMKISGSNFWFWNRETCRAFCMCNNVNTEHWKKTHEEPTFGFVELLNLAWSFYDANQECKCFRGDTKLEDEVKLECHDNVNSKPEDDPESALREFKEGDSRSTHWVDGDDGECLSSDKEQE